MKATLCFIWCGLFLGRALEFLPAYSYLANTLITAVVDYFPPLAVFTPSFSSSLAIPRRLIPLNCNGRRDGEARAGIGQFVARGKRQGPALDYITANCFTASAGHKGWMNYLPFRVSVFN